MKPIKLPGPLSRSPKPKQIPYTLPFELTLHAAYSVQMNCGAYMWKGGQSKQLTGASPGRRLNSLPRLTSSSESTSTSTRCLAPNEARICRLSCWKTSQEQEKLAYKRQKKHQDDADHWTGQQWSQRTWNAGCVEGWHQPASSSSSRWHS